MKFKQYFEAFSKRFECCTIKIAALLMQNGSRNFRKITKLETMLKSAISTQYSVFKMLILTQPDTTFVLISCSSSGVRIVGLDEHTCQA